MAGESVLDYFWQEFASIEWATDMALGDLFDVSLWTPKLCGSLCDLYLISQSGKTQPIRSEHGSRQYTGICFQHLPMQNGSTEYKFGNRSSLG